MGKSLSALSLSSVNVGSTANDGTGDPARTAFQKVNSNSTDTVTHATAVNTALTTGMFTDVSGEINGLTAKASPTASDIVMIEDAAASNAKKKSTVGNILAAITGIVHAFTKQQYFAEATLTDGASIAWNLEDAQTATVELGGNRTLSNPTNMQAGATYILRVVQDSTGSRTLAYGANYAWPGGTAPTLSTAAGATDILSFYSDGSTMYGVINQAFS